MRQAEVVARERHPGFQQAGGRGSFRLAGRRSLVAVVGQSVQLHDVLFSRFASQLVTSVESCALEDYTSAYLEKVVKALDHRVFYTFLSASVTPVDVKTASASSPRQYNTVLTCCVASELPSPDATRKWSKRRRHRASRPAFGS